MNVGLSWTKKSSSEPRDRGAELEALAYERAVGIAKKDFGKLNIKCDACGPDGPSGSIDELAEHIAREHDLDEFEALDSAVRLARKVRPNKFVQLMPPCEAVTREGPPSPEQDADRNFPLHTNLASLTAKYRRITFLSAGLAGPGADEFSVAVCVQGTTDFCQQIADGAQIPNAVRVYSTATSVQAASPKRGFLWRIAERFMKRRGAHIGEPVLLDAVSAHELLACFGSDTVVIGHEVGAQLAAIDAQVANLLSAEKALALPQPYICTVSRLREYGGTLPDVVAEKAECVLTAPDIAHVCDISTRVERIRDLALALGRAESQAYWVSDATQPRRKQAD